MRLRRHLSYANVMATAAVFIALGGGAYALQRNSVGTRALKPGAVKAKQLAGKAVKTRKLTPKAVTGKKLASQAVKGGKIAPRAVKGGKLDFRGFVRSGSGGTGVCDPAGLAFASCGSVDVNLPVAGQALIIAGGGQNSVGGSAASGQCQIRVDGAQVGASVNPGEDGVSNTDVFAQNGFANTAVADVTPGPHRYDLACNQTAGDQRINDSRISVLVIGRG